MTDAVKTNTENSDEKGKLPEAAAANDKVVVIEHLKKSFGKLDVLKDINLYLNKGENLVVMGKSGTGKSVLIKCTGAINGPGCRNDKDI